MSSLIKKVINNKKCNLFISGFNNKSIDKYLGVNDNNYYIYAINSAMMSKNSNNDRYYTLNIERYSMKREIKKCNKCSMNCEIVNIYRNNELIDSFGNSCIRGENNKLNNRIYS